VVFHHAQDRCERGADEGGSMSKDPRKKPIVQPSGEAGKPVEGTPAQQEAAFVPSPLPHPALAPELWAHLDKTMIMLIGHFNSKPETLDFGPLKTVIGACIYMLLKSTRLGDGRARAAVIALYEATHQGCERLAEIAVHEKSRDVLRAFACEKSDWPVMLSLKKSSHDKADEFLKDISVGTASNPPTANTKLESDAPWIKLAVMLIDKINATRQFQALEARKEKSNSAIEQAIIDRELIEARKWPEVMKLPPTLNKKNAPQYWSVAKEMLKNYWETNPDEAKNDFKKVEVPAKKSLEKSGEITGGILNEKSRAKLRAKTRVLAIHSVRKAFCAIATKR
jgi:hypothetical protein